MGFFDELEKNETPKGGSFSQNKGITDFVRKHFYEIAYVRSKGYSWKQVANAILKQVHFQSNDFPNTLQNIFHKVRDQRSMEEQ